MLKTMMVIAAVQAATIVVGLARTKIMAVFLGPEGVGIVGVIDQLVQVVASISALSLPFVGLKFLSLAHSKGAPEFARGYSSWLTALLGVTALGAALSVGVVLWRPELLGAELAAYRAILIPALLAVPVLPLQAFLASALAAAQRPRGSAVLALVAAVSLTAATGGGILVGGLTGLYWGSLGAGAVLLAATVVYLKARLHLPILHPDRSVRRQLRDHPDIVAFMIISCGVTFSLPVAMFVARHAVLASFNEAEAGLLHAAIAVSYGLGLLLGPLVSLYLMPLLSRDTPAADKVEAAAQFQRRLAIVAVVLGMPMVLFPEWLLLLLFSPAFTSVSQVLFLFIVGVCIHSLARVYQSLLVGLDDLVAYGVIVIAGQISLGVIAWLLVPQYGIPSVGLALVASSLGIYVAALTRLTSRHGMVVGRSSLALVVYGVGGLAVAGALVSQAGATSPALAMGKLGLWGLFAASLLAFLSRDERGRLTHVVEMFPGRVRGIVRDGMRAAAPPERDDRGS